MHASTQQPERYSHVSQIMSFFCSKPSNSLPFPTEKIQRLKMSNEVSDLYFPSPLYLSFTSPVILPLGPLASFLQPPRFLQSHSHLRTSALAVSSAWSSLSPDRHMANLLISFGCFLKYHLSEAYTEHPI